MQLLQRLLPLLMDVLNAELLADMSRDLELLYWPVLGHSQSPCFFEVPAFLGTSTPDQPMAPALVVERLMDALCPPLPVDVAPAHQALGTGSRCGRHGFWIKASTATHLVAGPWR